MNQMILYYTVYCITGRDINHYVVLIMCRCLRRWAEIKTTRCQRLYYPVWVYSQPAIEGYRVTMVQIFVTRNLSIQICSIHTRDER